MKRKAAVSSTLLQTNQGPPPSKKRQKGSAFAPTTSPQPLAHRVRASLLRCLTLHFDNDEIATALAKKFKIQQIDTRNLLKKIQEKNPSFFEAYHVRVRVWKQLLLYNSLVRQQREQLRQTRAARSYLNTSDKTSSLLPPPGTSNAPTLLSPPMMQGHPKTTPPNWGLPAPQTFPQPPQAAPQQPQHTNNHIQQPQHPNDHPQQHYHQTPNQQTPQPYHNNPSSSQPPFSLHQQLNPPPASPHQNPHPFSQSTPHQSSPPPQQLSDNPPQQAFLPHALSPSPSSSQSQNPLHLSDNQSFQSPLEHPSLGAPPPADEIQGFEFPKNFMEVAETDFLSVQNEFNTFFGNFDAPESLFDDWGSNLTGEN